MGHCALFLGPSLPREEAEAWLGNECLIFPPVKRGDLAELPEDVQLIAIVDGVFHGESAVGHREILEQLRKGVTVVGGGSMGALRASELHTFGMIGLGEVFRMYADGTIEGDDEVALIFNPEDLEALSEPLVNMRHNLARAVSADVISASEMEEIILRLHQVHYPKRTKGKLLEIASEVLGEESLSRFEMLLEERYVDVKREDALEIVRFVEKSMRK